MSTTTETNTFSAWLEALKDIQVTETDATEELINFLAANDFTSETINDDCFKGYFNGNSESEAGKEAAKSIADLHSRQEFLATSIDWDRAWHNLKKGDGYVLARTDRRGVWALFAKNRGTF